MRPFIFKKIVFHSRLQRYQCIQRKNKYMIINQRNFYSLPNGPEDPDYIMIFLTALSSYYFVKMISYKK